MNFRLHSLRVLLLALTWLAGCGAPLSPAAHTNFATETATQFSVSAPATPIIGSGHTATVAPRVFTLDDNDRNVTLTVGERFGLELGPSVGSPWAIDVSDPVMLVPTIHQLSSSGNRVFFQTVRSGNARIDANSHIICSGHGACPEVTTYFTLNLQIFIKKN